MRTTIAVFTFALAVNFCNAQSTELEGVGVTPPTENRASIFGENLGTSGKYGGWDFRLFKPSARIFFDTGSTDSDEIDIFQDGNINASIDLVNLVYRFNTGADFRNEPKSSLWWGPSIGFGITSPAEDSDDGTEDASNAPVLLLTVGMFLEYELTAKTSVLIEAGYAVGFTSDESFADKDDGALFVGLSLDF